GRSGLEGAAGSRGERRSGGRAGDIAGEGPHGDHRGGDLEREGAHGRGLAGEGTTSADGRPSRGTGHRAVRKIPRAAPLRRGRRTDRRTGKAGTSPSAGGVRRRWSVPRPTGPSAP